MSSRNTDKYFKSSLGMKDQIAPEVNKDYHSDLVHWLRENGHEISAGNLTFVLAKEFGFCYGVDKAVDMAYEARAKFPDRRIFLTYEIIHNPRVNARLREMDIQFLSGGLKSDYTLDDIQPEDVVLMPAFGVSASMLEELKKKDCILVDTTCGSVVHVWKRVERYARDGYTSLVHGKAHHAETIATVSQAQKMGGSTVVVFDEKEAQLVCDIIEGKRPSSDIYTLPKEALSEGFDPDADLQRIGVANQTTMLASESLGIARMVGDSLKRSYGESEIDQHFRSFDTICSATQERQDAIIDLVDRGDLDIMIIIGGYNSSNTGHLLEIASEKLPAFHICDASEIISKHEIRHKPVNTQETIVTSDWLPDKPLKIGFTAGASTPNKAIGETMERIASIRGSAHELVASRE